MNELSTKDRALVLLFGVTVGTLGSGLIGAGIWRSVDQPWANGFYLWSGAGMWLGYCAAVALVKPRERAIPQLYNATTIQVTEQGGKVGTIGRFPVTPDKMQLLARGLHDGDSLTEAVWLRRGFTRNDIAEVRSELIKRGWLEWRSPGTPQRGVVLTRQGAAVMRYLAGIPPATPPGYVSR